MKLAECVTELEAVFGRMTISDRDRATSAYIGITALAAEKPFYDPAARSPYVDAYYLREAAREAIAAALVSGQLPAWTDYDGQFVELDNEIMFGPSKWRWSHSVATGTYLALNTFLGRDGKMREECEGHTLWVRADDWPRTRSELVEHRERIFRSELGEDWVRLLGSLTIGADPTVAGLIEPQQPVGPHWTLHEAVAWLVSEDDALVCEQRQKLTNYADRTRIAGSAVWLGLKNAFNRQELDQASERLRAACEGGSVAATGIPASRGSRRSIPAADFTNVELWPGHGGQLHRVVGGIPEPARWLDLRFDAEKVRALNPSAPNSTTSPAPPAQLSPKGGRHRDRAEIDQVIRDGVEQRLGVEPVRKLIGITKLSRDEIRARHSELWQERWGNRPGRGANKRVPG